jgi:hypothetical protein
LIIWLLPKIHQFSISFLQLPGKLMVQSTRGRKAPQTEKELHMNKFLKIAGVAALVVAVSLVAVVGVSLAQGPTPTPTPHGKFGGGMGWFGFGMGGQGGWAAFDATAKALGMTPDELFNELHSGKTLADIEKEKNVDAQTVANAVAAVRKDAISKAIEQAVTDGRLTRAQADWLLQGLNQGWLGRGFGHGGFGPGRLNPNKTPTPGNSQGSGLHRRFTAPGNPL